MPFYPVFLSVVVLVRNQEDQLERILSRAVQQLSSLVVDYELIVVDNSSEDGSVNLLKRLTAQEGLPNLQVYALTKEVSPDTAAWVGLENALGDFVGVIDPLTDDIGFLPKMLEKAVSGVDVVFSNNLQKVTQGFFYRFAHGLFHAVYRVFNGIHLAKEAPSYRLLSKRVIHFILQHTQPALTYRYLPATGGFSRVNLEYSALPSAANTKRLSESFDRGLRLLVSSSHAPLRLVTSLSLFGAAANLIYSAYVVAIAIFKADVAAGWVSLSLQQSGMFFLISLVLLVLSEYILQMVSLSNGGVLYHVGQEFTSARITRKEKLNVEIVAPVGKGT
ncbi:MAG: glycosyltransferase [Bdellovibrionia bacterium]